MHSEEDERKGNVHESDSCTSVSFSQHCAHLFLPYCKVFVLVYMRLLMSKIPVSNLVCQSTPVPYCFIIGSLFTESLEW